MRFLTFNIENFKGIEKLTFRLEKSINANVYTLVGLNESGKTTILEAINFFNNADKVLGVLEDVPGTVIKDYNTIIPINKRDNFNGSILISATLKLEPIDFATINSFAVKNTVFKELENKDTVSFGRKYNYENSKFKSIINSWTGFKGKLKKTSNIRKKLEYVDIDHKVYPLDNSQLYFFTQEMIPSIIYFPNFLFDFPSKIYLESLVDFTAKEQFYFDLIQDILYSLENSTNVYTHLIERIKSVDKNDKRSLSSLLLKMSSKVSEVIFTAWNKIFKREIKDTRVIIDFGVDELNLSYLEFSIESQNGIYQINERSLGFRWFFTFLLFTQFRPFRIETSKNILFLFDEPASNLHSNAQKQLLDSFANLTVNSKIIYTTHSHHLINPNWLESTYVVINKGVSLDPLETDIIKATNISIERYKDFVVKHPHNTAYFQPILDILDYAPSNLELVPKCTFFEGKNDYYTLKYFNNLILDLPNNINMAPSTGAGNLDTLISLYMGWGKEFLIILDSDNEGKKQKDRYIEKFGLSVEENIFTLEDIDSTWGSISLEKLFNSKDLLNFQKKIFASSEKYNKKVFNRAIQEALINKIKFDFSENTIENFQKILKFLENRFQVPFKT